MIDDFNLAFSVDVLAASLSLDRGDTDALLTQLAQKLKGALPRNTQVQRSWFGLGSIQTVTLCFDDYHYQVSREPYGALSNRAIKVVRGVKIKTTELTSADWNRQVAEALARLAAQSTEVRDGLNQFIGG
ncbi:hypothetical protein V2H45_04525 [Tumidithrix elongata RA019]|uniref:Uncharacterized protein n=1 Tax=Tumidithrix elongata BACA0141 TaxID=2716417 RepID=A0AAW9PYE6_9CYAN|nr:hypothetical protein [Tumidithrix elongata RA019]